jgi:hypothetical protein
MLSLRSIAAALAISLVAPAAASAAVIGGTYYAPQYDYREFFAATDGKAFQVQFLGTPFPGVDPAALARSLLPMMQRAKPRPALTFTTDRPSPPPRPDYRLVLVFDPALNLNSDPVCAGEPARFRPGTPGRFYVYAIYCRNDRAMSQTTAWTDASGPDDPRLEQLFRQLFPVVFSEQQMRWAFNDPALR